jgi:hypothetical protein
MVKFAEVLNALYVNRRGNPLNVKCENNALSEIFPSGLVLKLLSGGKDEILCGMRGR